MSKEKANAPERNLVQSPFWNAKMRITTKAITHFDLIPFSDSAPCRSPSERSDAGGWILTEVIGIRQRMG